MKRKKNALITIIRGEGPSSDGTKRGFYFNVLIVHHWRFRQRVGLPGRYLHEIAEIIGLG